MKELKIGDLVTISSYGRKRKRTQWVDPGDVGIVVKKIRFGNPAYGFVEYRVKWALSDYKSRKKRIRSYWEASRDFPRSDLRFAK